MAVNGSPGFSSKKGGKMMLGGVAAGLGKGDEAGWGGGGRGGGGKGNADENGMRRVVMAMARWRRDVSR